jgi:hypothetical protein
MISSSYLYSRPLHDARTVDLTEIHNLKLGLYAIASICLSISKIRYTKCELSQIKMKKQSVSDILNLLPAEELIKIGNSSGVDYGVSRLYGSIMVKLLIFGLLRSDRLSMRVLEEFYNSALFSFFSGKGAHQTKHSSLASRLTSMNVDYFATLFQWCSQHFAPLLPHNKLSKQLIGFDSTLCAISSALVSWGMRVGRSPKEAPAKVQFKFSIGLTNFLPTSLQRFFDQPHLSQETALKEAIQKAAVEPADRVVFDLGLKSRKTLKYFDEQGIHFVTRGGSQLQYHFEQLHRHIKGRSCDGLRFLQDRSTSIPMEAKS